MDLSGGTAGPAGPIQLDAGRMAERTKATVLKTVDGATRSWVRIPVLPPETISDLHVRQRCPSSFVSLGQNRGLPRATRGCRCGQ